MQTRRNFIKSTGMGLAGITFSGYASAFVSNPIGVQIDYNSLRPVTAHRKFVSKSVDELIEKIKIDIADPELSWLFSNCFPNTLDTTVTYNETAGIPDTFVITGDIHAMWLRDSSAQVWPYLPLLNNDEPLRKLIAGVINRQVKCILLDPYANAFLDSDAISEWKSDITEMKPGIHERKWEIDSLCYPIRLAHGYWKATGDTSVFGTDWLKAMELVVDTFIVQQRKQNEGPYSFKRVTAWQTDTVPGNGMGNPIRPVGLICSVFRPSDDATIFPFLIPSNFFAAKAMLDLSEILTFLGILELDTRCRELGDEITVALFNHAEVNHPKYGHIYSFETDGFGNHLMMDDSNIPSLLALPYLGCVELNDPVYQNTRRFVLSTDNPWYFKGTAAWGIGSPHTLLDKIWPMTIIMQALTSNDPDEIRECLRMLKTTHAGKGFMHESFNKDNPADYTRSWFAWANTLFGELIIKVHSEFPELLKE